MKPIVYILIGSLLFVGVNRFLRHIDQVNVKTELVCDMDCCDTHEEVDDQNQDSDGDRACPSGCNCDCCFHIVAIEYQFLTISVVAPRVYFFGSYSNEYNFHYYTPIFEPPRFS